MKCKEVYNKGNSALSLGWRNDGPKRQENSNMSEKELVLWLSNEENYARYRGGPGYGGVRKVDVCKEIMRQLNYKFE